MIANVDYEELYGPMNKKVDVQLEVMKSEIILKYQEHRKAILKQVKLRDEKVQRLKTEIQQLYKQKQQNPQGNLYQID